MQVLSYFDSAVPKPFEVTAKQLSFELRPGQQVLNVQISGAPPELVVHLMVNEKGAPFVERQGLYVSRDRLIYDPLPLERSGEERFSATISGAGGDLWIANRIPYGRDGLDRLIADVGGTPGLKVSMLSASGRALPVFEFEGAAAPQTVHWFIAGEDCWETAGSWVGDGLVRELASGSKLSAHLLSRSSLRVVPLVSPFSSTQRGASYTTLEGKCIYGAATWGDEVPPPEYRLLRDAVVSDARAGKLGLLLTVHSWQGAHDHSGMEFVRTAGANEITGQRLEWAKATLEALTRDVPAGKGHVSEKIWHPGLARDYMLAEHNAVSYRIEITTVGQSYQDFRETARGLLSGANSIEDWRPALPRQ